MLLLQGFFRSFTSLLLFRRCYPLSLFLLSFIFVLFFAGSSLAESAQEIDASEEPHALDGKIIREIRIKVGEIFDQPETNFIFRTANNLKVLTREEVIERELLFSEGEAYSDFLREESERNLRTLRYLRNIDIIPIPDGDFVDLEVIVQDTWTLLPKVSFSSGDGRDRTSLGLAESNIAGTGKRLEVLYEKDDSRETIEGVWADPRVWGTRNEFIGAAFLRDDGERFLLLTGEPFRSFVQRSAWSIDADIADIVGRLYEAGDERFIFQERRLELSSRYTIARGQPEQRVQRYSVGLDYISNEFSDADSQDFDNLNLDPFSVSRDPALLADDRRFIGPTIGYQSLVPDFVAMKYIDRFDRVDDYNLGEAFALNAHIAPRALGSHYDALLLNSNRSQGHKLSENAFLLGEIGANTRLASGGLEDSLLRGEIKYFNVLGPQFIKDIFLGSHTLAASFIIDYGWQLDRDRELLAGADNLLRGYEARSFSGSRRIGLNLEDRIHIVDDAFQLVSAGAAFFVDVGGTTRDGLGDLLSDAIYANVGAGLRFAIPRSSSGRVFRLDVALPLRDGPDGSQRFEPRIIFSSGQLFNSRLRSQRMGSDRANVQVGLDR